MRHRHSRPILLAHDYPFVAKLALPRNNWAVWLIADVTDEMSLDLSAPVTRSKFDLKHFNTGKIKTLLSTVAIPDLFNTQMTRKQGSSYILLVTPMLRKHWWVLVLGFGKYSSPLLLFCHKNSDSELYWSCKDRDARI